MKEQDQSEMRVLVKVVLPSGAGEVHVVCPWKGKRVFIGEKVILRFGVERHMDTNPRRVTDVVHNPDGSLTFHVEPSLLQGDEKVRQVFPKASVWEYLDCD